jgi:hypothetical protein
MPQITQVGRVMIPVNDQDAGIASYTNTLGTVPLLFFFRDQDGNQLMIVEAQ